MFARTFYHSSIKKYVSLFGTLFNDIFINKEDDTDQVLQTIKVPLTYAPRDKMLARLRENPDLGKPLSQVLPRMSFLITGITYDSARKLVTTGRYTSKTTTAAAPSNVYNPVPYTISFDLNIASRTTEEGSKIVEQILPYFTPDWSITANLVPELSLTHDIPVVLKTCTYDDAYEGDYSERRAVVWTLSFDMFVYFYGPIKESKIIKMANTNFFAGEYGVDPEFDMNVNIVPGLMANGSPTTNAALTVPPTSISANDNYDYIITKN